MPSWRDLFEDHLTRFWWFGADLVCTIQLGKSKSTARRIVDVKLEQRLTFLDPVPGPLQHHGPGDGANRFVFHRSTGPQSPRSDPHLSPRRPGSRNRKRGPRAFECRWT